MGGALEQTSDYLSTFVLPPPPPVRRKLSRAEQLRRFREADEQSMEDYRENYEARRAQEQMRRFRDAEAQSMEDYEAWRAQQQVRQFREADAQGIEDYEVDEAKEETPRQLSRFHSYSVDPAMDVEFLLSQKYEPPQQEDEPDFITDNQRARLEEVGVEVSDNTEIEREIAQAVIDFYENNPGLLKEGLSFEEATESLAIIARMDFMDFNVGLSAFIPKAWGIDELQNINNIMNTVSDTASERFIEIYDEEALITVAYFENILPENARDAAFVLLIEGERNIDYDNGIGSLSSVAYINGTEENPRLWHSIRDPETNENYTYVPGTYALFWGGMLPEHLRSQATQGGRLVVWWGRASGVGIIISKYVFSGNTLAGGYDNDFPPEALIIHEFSHLVDFGASGSAQNLLSTDLNDWAWVEQPRSTNDAAEIRADIITNGLMGNWTGDDLTDFNAFLDQSFRDNYGASDYEDVEVPLEYFESVPWYNPPQPTGYPQRIE